ncbi:hypothetical protein OS493_006966 [Desmophyllum pertusum]|uniref:Uncharacterized protein n=1 Tax=Desmophyllum pertusum TaxID=174260 RepID=A0A9W9ZFM5_9CNID|nr:hypothetical protein OS493_006966 [Desmophyllum pertusum]
MWLSESWRESGAHYSDMADMAAGEENNTNLEVLVRQIMSSVQTVNRGNIRESSERNVAGNINKEINQRFLLPRGRASRPSTSTSTSADQLAAEFNPSNYYSSQHRQCYSLYDFEAMPTLHADFLLHAGVHVVQMNNQRLRLSR